MSHEAAQILFVSILVALVLLTIIPTKRRTI